MENEKKRGFFFRRADRPDAKPEDTTPTLGYFFKLLFRKFGKLISLNLIMVMLYIPLIVAVVLYFFGESTPTVESALYAPLLGVSIGGGSPTANLLLGTFSGQFNVPFMTPGRIVAIALLIGFTVITWGWQNVGATYNLRSLVRGDSCFLLSDYFYAIRRNLKQGLLFGLLDVLILVVLVIDFFYFYTLADIFWFGVCYILFIVLIVTYSIMRFYIYHMMITFDLSIKKILKNALIFVPLGFKRNLIGFLGIITVSGINAALILPSLKVGFALPLILPLFYLPALAGFIAAYAAWPNIQRHMIDAFDNAEPRSKTADEEIPEESTAECDA
jgi:uncharacterized membrane protein YesL